MLAHVLEFRLFADEPALLLRAQRELWIANFALLRHIAIPAAILAMLGLAAWIPAANYFGSAALQAGDVVMVEARSIEPALELAAPFGAVVESPGLRVPKDHSTVWRVRAMSPVNAGFRALPGDVPVLVHYPAARYLGLPWWLAFGLASVAALGGLAFGP